MRERSRYAVGRAVPLAILAAHLAAQPHGAAMPLEVPTVRYRLDNGMTVILAPEAASEIVAVRLVYHVGSRDEVSGATGLAHLFEHMMFNGATRYGPKQFDAVLERAGGYGNAYTRNDYTTYFTEVPPQSLPRVLDLESDRMVDLSLDQDMLERERQVVLQERRQTIENQPEMLLDTLLAASLFQTHPNRWPVLGWVADIESADVGTCRAFYRRFYAPDNATLVLAGAIDVEAVRADVAAAFGGLPRGPGARVAVAAEPERTHASRILLEREAAAPLLLIGFVGPNARAAEHAALDLLAEVLVRGQTARLERRLVRADRTVTSLALRHDWTLDQEPLVLSLTLAPRQDADAVIEAVFAEIDRLVAEGVDDAELSRARVGASTSILRGLATATGRADLLAQFEVTVGDHRACLDLPQRYAEVDSGSLQAVAKQILRRDRAAIAELRPRSEVGR
ncbi:MAG: pitrilysin family protein [Planctomycetota bacterium]